MANIDEIEVQAKDQASGSIDKIAVGLQAVGSAAGATTAQVGLLLARGRDWLETLEKCKVPDICHRLLLARGRDWLETVWRPVCSQSG